MALLSAISNVFGFGKNVTDPKQYDIKKNKRLNYRIEAAMQYVFVTEKTGEYRKISKTKQNKLRLHYRKRIFDVS
jgi:predicted component of type VI protein secretion system